MRRQAHQNKARGRDEQALLSPEAPILSDDVSDVGPYTETPNNSHDHNHHSSAAAMSSNKKGWRSRLFGGSSRSTSSRSTGRAASAGRNDSRNLPMMSAPADRSVSAFRAQQHTQHAHQQHQHQQNQQRYLQHHQQQYMQQRLQQYPQQYQHKLQQELRTTARFATIIDTNSSTPGASALSGRPEKRDDDSNSKGAAASVYTKMTTTTATATPQSVTSSTASSVHLNDRSTRAPPLSQSRLVPSGVVGTVLRRPFGREAVRLQDQKVSQR